MRADRLLSVLMLLRHRGTMTAAQIAAELEVSTRTVLRDVEALGVAGVPVYTDRGRGGGISLLPGYRTDLTGLTLDEAKALLAGAPDSPAFAGAMRKVAAALPEAHRREAAAAAQRIHVRPDGFARAPEPEPHLGELQRAVIDGLRVRATYRPRGSGAAERTLDPVGLVHAGQSWYLMALRDGARRTYRTSRFEAVTVLAEPARRPAEVDLAAEFEESRASFRSGREAITVELRADEYGWTKLSGLGTIVAPPGPDGAGTLGFSDLGRAVWTLWGALPHVEIVGPPAVRAALADRLAAAAAALGPS
ncbi:WYL domain-containing protein [Tsukamurella asaccharolytica]|uniref:WYL domain-containing protein n=1 Tax=Tsukamurella asaccharolytica TaxID=2592067 RepID=A0A5C5RD97_9ACTN|nr:WYL domain-containing protein [Tsukamurella asaccharolytica]TWS20403.1 WYL domain-containing protein [Tsukamurella asaccharolytica]